MSGARDQIARMMALVPYLNGKEIPLAEVAELFGVTPKRIVDDLNVLYWCGLPGLMPGDMIDIDFEALSGDGIVRLSNAEYLSRPLQLNSAEAAALVVALRTLRESADEATRPVVNQVLGKLEHAAGPAASVGHVIDVPVTVSPAKAALVKAIKGRKQVRLDYLVVSRDEATSRIVDPIGLVGHDTFEYLDAWCHQAQARRTFRLDRIESATVLQTRASAHDLAPLDLSEGLFQPSPHSTVVTLKLAASAAWIAEYYPVEDLTALGDGDILVRLRASDPLWLIRLVMRLAPYAQVVDPPEIAEQVRNAAQTALANYVG